MSFLLIDRLIRLNHSQVIAEKMFDAADPVFADHFPGAPVVPGSLLIEGMAQSCGWWISWKGEGERKSVLLMAEGVQFRHFVKPGQTIRFEAEILQSAETRARFKVSASVEEKLVAKAELSFAVFSIHDSSGPFVADSLAGWMKEKFIALGGPAAAGEVS